MVHLYVHVPFCARRCSYCDFAIAVRRRVPSDEFVDAILTEYQRRRTAESWGDAPFHTIYLGGGTPSRLSPSQVARLLDGLPRAAEAEVTLEANPDDVTAAAARTWSRAGVNRVSLGVQSFQPEVLAWMHRLHDAPRAEHAARILQDAGIPSISLDLIFGLPPELHHDLDRDLARALTLAPHHLSVYGLTLEARTPYARWVARGQATAAVDERYASEFLRVHETLVAAGFEHYEVSNYARSGRRSRHNGAYWSGADYGGLGPSAHGFHRGVRRWNTREWVAYLRAIRSGDDPVGGVEEPTPAERRLERVYLALRTADGLDPEAGDELRPEVIEAATSEGWLTGSGGRLAPTPAGWLLLDELVTLLTTSPRGG